MMFIGLGASAQRVGVTALDVPLSSRVHPAKRGHHQTARLRRGNAVIPQMRPATVGPETTEIFTASARNGSYDGAELALSAALAPKYPRRGCS